MFESGVKVGTWTTIEVERAMKEGYELLEIYEIVHFPQRSDTLFAEYVALFLKMKQEAKGWQKMGCNTEEEKQDFIDQYAMEQGVLLDYNKVEENPGKYAIAKLCLNNLWGKYGQKNNFNQTIDTYSEADFNKYAHNDEYEVKGVVMHDSRCRTITYNKKREFMMKPGYTNIAIAAFTTAHARLRLYEALNETGQRTLYMDTDSVIYVDDGTVDLQLGPYLGDLTNELEDGEWIIEFVSTGPKSYAYRTNTGNTYCKVKGFTLNHSTSKLLNFESLREMVFDTSKEVMTKPLQFTIDEFHNITTKEWGEGEGKRFKVTFDKRKVKRRKHMIDTEPHYNKL